MVEIWSKSLDKFRRMCLNFIRTCWMWSMGLLHGALEILRFPLMISLLALLPWLFIMPIVISQHLTLVAVFVLCYYVAGREDKRREKALYGRVL